jgi:hypothetical protein
VAPAALASSRSVGSSSTVPFGNTTRGRSVASPASVATAWPSGESASMNLCGTAQRPSTSRSS